MFFSALPTVLKQPLYAREAKFFYRPCSLEASTAYRKSLEDAVSEVAGRAIDILARNMTARFTKEVNRKEVF